MPCRCFEAPAQRSLEKISRAGNAYWSGRKELWTMPYFFASLPSRLRSFPEMRAAWLILPPVRDSSSAT